MKLSLSSILLFSLVTPFIMNVSLSPIPGVTPYILFGFIFLSILGYIIMDLFNTFSHYFLVKSLLLVLVIFLVLGSAFSSTIIARHNTAPIYQVHDIILQQEAAIRFFLTGKNPYATTYFGTPLEQWNYGKEINPALYHFVMEPFYLYSAIPFYYISNHTLGYFDARIPLYLLFFTLLGVAYIIPYEKEKKLSFVTLLAFNPAMLSYIYEGRSDMYMYPFLLVGFYFLTKEKYRLSSFFVALSFLIKQSSWPLLPLYITYLFYKKRSIKKILQPLIVFIATLFIGSIQFISWNSKAYLDSTILYLSGNSAHSYPISGYGFGMLLHEVGVVKDLRAYYPFTIWQIIISIPVLICAIKYLKNNTTVKTLIILYGIFLFIYWYFSRYMNNSHFAFLTVVFITAYFWPENEKNITQ